MLNIFHPTQDIEEASKNEDIVNQKKKEEITKGKILKMNATKNDNHYDAAHTGKNETKIEKAQQRW